MVSTAQLIQIIRHFMDFAMHHSMRERAHFAKATGLSMPQFGILMQLHYRHNCGVSDLSQRFDITNAAASQLVDKLVQSGYIRREEDPQDRRAKSLKLTDKGIELIEEGIEQRYRWVESLAEQLTAEERVKIDEALTILTRAAQEVDETSKQVAM